MASWREIDRVRKAAPEFRALASRLLKHDELTEWESSFLEDIVLHKLDVIEFTTRQSEKLLQIRDDMEPVGTVRGFSVALLIRRCFEARLDLSEDDEAWIAELREGGTTTIKRGAGGRLLRCARQLGLVDDGVPA